MFGSVAAVDIWGDKLEFLVPFFFDDAPVGMSCFIIEYLQINSVSIFLEARHYVIVGGEAMSVVSGLEWLH